MGAVNRDKPLCCIFTHLRASAVFCYNKTMMTRQERIGVIWGMNGHFYDAIMNRIPAWLTFTDDAAFDAAFDDWFYSELGL